jgi:hypothetical protein
MLGGLLTGAIGLILLLMGVIGAVSAGVEIAKTGRLSLEARDARVLTFPQTLLYLIFLTGAVAGGLALIDQ